MKPIWSQKKEPAINNCTWHPCDVFLHCGREMVRKKTFLWHLLTFDCKYLNQHISSFYWPLKWWVCMNNKYNDNGVHTAWEKRMTFLCCGCQSFLHTIRRRLKGTQRFHSLSAVPKIFRNNFQLFFRIQSVHHFQWCMCGKKYSPRKATLTGRIHRITTIWGQC